MLHWGFKKFVLPGFSRRPVHLKIRWIIPIILFSVLAIETDSLLAQTSPVNFLSNADRRIRLQSADPWFGKDKFDHFLLSAFLTTAGYYSARENFKLAHSPAQNWSGGLTLSLGIGKEVWDKRSKRGMASVRDLAADFLGVGLGILICHVSS